MPLTSKLLSGFPDASSTGVRDGTALKVYNGDMTVTKDNTVISGLEIHGTLRIEAKNVIVRDVKIVNDGGDNGILIPDPYSATVEYCDIIGSRNGISGSGTFRANDLSHNENGINVYGPSLIVDNYIHDMSGGPDAHFDGIENNGASGMVLRHNTIINDHGQTAAVMLNNAFGSIHDAVIDNNYLAGGGYTIYSADVKSGNAIEGVQITNNVLGQGYWGNYDFTGNDPLLKGNDLIGKSWPTPVSDGAPPTTPGPDPTDPVTPPEPTDPVTPPDPGSDPTGPGRGHHGQGHNGGHHSNGSGNHASSGPGCGHGDRGEWADDRAFGSSDFGHGGGHRHAGRSTGDGDHKGGGRDFAGLMNAFWSEDHQAPDHGGHHGQHLDHHAFSI